MSYERSSLRYAHTSGHTSLIYRKKPIAGEFVITTCGSDGDIRFWRGINDDDPTSNCLGEFVLCLAESKDGDRLLASTDRNTVQAYTVPEMDKDGTLMRFTAPVTCLCVDGEFMAAGSEDTLIKVLRIVAGDAGGENEQKELKGHTGPVLALDICAAKDLLASVGGDGQLKVWNLVTAAEVHSISGLSRTNSFERADCFGTPTFEPRNGHSLSYVKDKEIYVLNTANWEVQFTLNDEHAKGTYSCCQFSSDGQFLAAGTSAGEISVYDFVRKQALRCEAPDSSCEAITALAWQPGSGKELAYCDASGQLGTIFATGKTAGGGGSAKTTAEGEVCEDLMDFDGNDFGDGGDANEDDLDMVHANGNDDEEDEEGTVSIEKLKNKIMNYSKAGEHSSHHHHDDDGDETSKDSLPPSISAEFQPKPIKRQAAFQPSATPAHLEHRYLVWNEVGIVTAHSADGAIDVEFHDASVHHALHIPNHQNQHTMASLSSGVLALSGSDSTRLVCIALAASGNKEWSAQMPDGESVEGLAANARLVAVVTNLNFLRLFSVLGTQREVISLPGSFLAVAGHGERLLVCYHSAPATPDRQQHLGALLLTMQTTGSGGFGLRTQTLPVPLIAGRNLVWLGFSDCGAPVIADSMGLVQLFSARAQCWFPVCDTLRQSASVSNNYFVVAVSERSQFIQAVLCRGCSYPMTAPRPMLQELPLQVPLCDADAEKSELEDRLVRASIMTVDGAEKVVKEAAIKLFALACRSELEPRAKELIETIACPELLMLAVKYATKLGRIHLSDRLSELMPQFEEQRALEREKQAEEEAMLVAQQFQPGGGDYNRAATPTTTKLLAPKAMEISSARRFPLKRFSLASSSGATNTPGNLKKPSSQFAVELTPNATASVSDTQENIAEYSSNIPKAEDGVVSTPKESVTRTPLNSVNPFAAKRKLADVDGGDGAHKGGGGLHFGSAGKLKMLKK